MQPIVVLGNPRSGTTLLRLILTCHKNISIPPEGPFFFILEPKYWKIKVFDDQLIEKFVSDLLMVPKMEEWNLDRDRLIHRLKNGSRSSFIDLVNGVHFEYMESHGIQKQRWGDKSVSYSIWRLGSIRRSLPHAHLIHIVRDGRDVACSYRALSGVVGKYAPNLPTNVLEIAFHWDHNVKRIHNFLKNWPKNQCSTIKYENLVTDPESEIRKLCLDLGEDFDPKMLDFHSINKNLNLEPKVYIRWKVKTLETITTTQVGRWKNEMSINDLELFTTLSGNTLRLFGYLNQENYIKNSISSRIMVNLFIFLMRLKQITRFGQSLFN